MSEPENASGANSPVPSHLKVSLWLIVAIAVCLLVLLPLVHQTVNLDGTIYASVARNMAEGVGSLWKPYFSRTLFPVFSEHLPFMMFLESIGFRLFGDSILVEKSFSFLTFLMSGLVLWRMWRRLNENDPQYHQVAPLTLVMAMIAGSLSWGFANGMLENLVILLTSLAVLLVVEVYAEDATISFGRRFAMLTAVAFLVVLAFFTKVTGLFPIAAPALYWLSFRRPKFLTVVLDSLVIVTVFVVSVFILWQFEGPRDAILRFADAQLFASISGARGSTGSRWSSAATLLRANSYPILVTLLMLLWARFARMPLYLFGPAGGTRLRRAIFMFLVGCSASLPILISKRVYTFYFNPAEMYFSAALAIVLVPTMVNMAHRFGPVWQRRVHAGLAVVLTGSLVFTALSIGKPGVDGAKIENAVKIASYVCPSAENCQDTVSACPNVWTDWELHAYLQRYYKMNVSRLTGGNDGTFVVANANCLKDLAGYVDTGVDLWRYRLMKRAGN